MSIPQSVITLTDSNPPAIPGASKTVVALRTPETVVILTLSLPKGKDHCISSLSLHLIIKRNKVNQFAHAIP